MTIFELSDRALRRAVPTSFRELGITERGDLQRLLRSQVETIAPDTFVICEEFGQWEDSSRRIDLLALDRAANLVVIELKRTDDGGHMELQAIRYAAMVSTMTFAQAAEAHRKFRSENAIEGDATEAILAFLRWTEPDEEHFAADVRIVLASEDFSREITTAVMWLNQRSLDIRCVRMKPYRLGTQVLIDVQQVVPLPEATDYQVRLREKSDVTRSARTGSRWNEASFMEALETQKGPAARALAEELLRWAEATCGKVGWGTGAQFGSFIPTVTAAGVNHYLFAVYTYGTVEIYFQYLKGNPPFDDPMLREQLRQRVNAILGIAIPADRTSRRPSFQLDVLARDENRRAFTDAFEWAIDTIRQPIRDDRAPRVD